MTAEVSPFRVAVDEADLEDLRGRLRCTRWPDREVVDDRSQGIPLAYVRDVCDHWLHHYDWRDVEGRLNALPQLWTSVDGLGFHVIHVRSPEPDALPIVMTHGWPGSVLEFLKVMGPLTDPVGHGADARDAFHLVCPSLPGFGFSEKPAEVGWGIERIADAWTVIMSRLGYERFGAQGGDRGGRVSTALALRHPDRLVGIHLSTPTHFPGEDDQAETEQEREALARFDHYRTWEAGYAAMQSTRPQTLGYGLVDSPVGQAAWILEKFWAWTDHDGDLERVLSRDELLDNVTLYWLTRSGASSGRSYWEGHRAAYDARDAVTVPTGMTVHPRDIYCPSRRWTERIYVDLRYWSEAPRGGHFSAFEQPDQFVDEVRACFRLLREDDAGGDAWR